MFNKNLKSNIINKIKNIFYVWINWGEHCIRREPGIISKLKLISRKAKRIFLIQEPLRIKMLFSRAFKFTGLFMNLNVFMDMVHVFRAYSHRRGRQSPQLPVSFTRLISSSLLTIASVSSWAVCGTNFVKI